MGWTERAALALAGAIDETPGVSVAATAIDDAGPAFATTAPGLPDDSRFEIGSVTKTMTAAVLAMLVNEQAVRLDDPIGTWLEAGPNADVRVADLATHTSGLPALPPNLRFIDRSNPWAGFPLELAEAGLPEAVPTPGHPWRYSNFGYQLLALILQRAGGQEYPTLIGERLLEPLSMKHSGVGSWGAGTRLTGHADGREVTSWVSPWGAGGVETTIADLARYLQACLFPPDTPVGAALALSQTVLRPGANGTEQALAWVVRPGGIREHSGATGGFTACAAIDASAGRAVAMLANTGGSPQTANRAKQAARLALGQLSG
jgi:serine-type D-Ala-D-Ala carboxypeptidase/endopeptidase